MEQALAMVVLVACGIGALRAVVAWQEAALAHRERLAETRASVARAAYTPAYPSLATYSPHQQYQYQWTGKDAPAAPPPLITEAPAPALPGVTTLGQVLAQGFAPTQERILLALGPGGTPLTASVGDDLCHIVLCGATGAGKTNTMRLLLVQLLAAGCAVYLLNPKHTDRHWRTGEDWTTLAAATTPGRAITDFAEIGAIMRRVRYEELPARQARFQRGAKPGVPLFLVIDEWPLIVGSDPTLADVLADLVRLGREYLIEILTASQDVLVDTIGGSSGDRAQFQTRYYGGGDATSKRVLMQPQPKGGLPEPPGRGVMYLWATPTGRKPELVRVPLVDNADITRLLGETGETGRNGTETGGTEPRGRVIEGVFQPLPPVAPVSPTPETGIDPLKRAAVLAGLRRMEKYGDLIERIWGVKAGGSQGYKEAYAAFQAILADLVKGA